uniref:N-arachidonyl glycine receptor n=1 Tax=Chrysemys picta bellii TaxID=8478 RepID=A0A8C3HY75_CHRPI
MYTSTTPKSDQNIMPGNLHPEEYRIASLVFYSFIFIIGLLVNITALWVFSCTTKKRTTITVYMMNVAFLDLIFIFSVPFRITYYAKEAWPFGDIFCRILGAFTVFYPSIALWLLAFISVDRYMAIVQPKHVKELRNTRKALLACIGIWIMTLASTSPLLFLYSDPDKTSNFTTCMKMLDIIHLKEVNMLNFSLIIYHFVHGRTSKLKPKAKERSIKIIVTLIVQVLVCFVPFHICFAFLMLQDEDQSYNPWAAFTTFLMNLSTCLDVILYYIVSKQFQARVISVMLYRNYLRSVRRKSFRSGSLRSLSNINSEMI